MRSLIIVNPEIAKAAPHAWLKQLKHAEAKI
jgi:hypothetical protein